MDTPPTVTDDELLAPMQCLLRSGRVKPVLLVEVTHKAFPTVERDRVVHCYGRLDSSLLKR